MFPFFVSDSSTQRGRTNRHDLAIVKIPISAAARILDAALQKEMVLVGAAHLAGEDSLLGLLKNLCT